MTTTAAHDHYRRSGIVSIRTYRKYFGDSYSVYDGTHFMEEEFVLSMLAPKIIGTVAAYMNFCSSE